VCIAAATLLATAACSSSGASTGGDAAPAAAAATYTGSAVVNLSYWSWTLNSQAVVDAFNATHPNIHVTYTHTVNGPNGYSKLFDAFKAGDGPDVFNCEYDMLPEFVSQGLTANLTSYIDAKTQSALGSALPLTTLGGSTWAVPIDIEPAELWYRADLFKKYDLAVPTTWAQFQSEARQLATVDPGAKLGAIPIDDPLWLAALSEQAGAQWYSTSGDSWKVNLTDAASEKVASYWQSLADKKLVLTVTSSSPSYGQAYSNGTVLTQIEPPYEGAYIKSGYPNEAGDWAVAPLPNWSGAATDGSEGGSSSVVDKNTKNLAAAAEFAEWLSTSPQALTTRMQGGKSTSLPVDASAAKAPETAFDTSYFYQHQNVFDLANAAAGTVSKSWIWGPEVPGVDTAMATPLGKVGSGGQLSAMLSTGQGAALRLMKNAGLSASAG
jgi:multiple sugar transport system substrate-binding protein